MRNVIRILITALAVALFMVTALTGCVQPRATPQPETPPTTRITDSFFRTGINPSYWITTSSLSTYKVLPGVFKLTGPGTLTLLSLQKATYKVFGDEVTTAYMKISILLGDSNTEVIRFGVLINDTDKLFWEVRSGVARLVYCINQSCDFVSGTGDPSSLMIEVDRGVFYALSSSGTLSAPQEVNELLQPGTTLRPFIQFLVESEGTEMESISDYSLETVLDVSYLNVSYGE